MNDSQIFDLKVENSKNFDAHQGYGVVIENYVEPQLPRSAMIGIGVGPSYKPPFDNWAYLYYVNADGKNYLTPSDVLNLIRDLPEDELRTSLNYVYYVKLRTQFAYAQPLDSMTLTPIGFDGIAHFYRLKINPEDEMELIPKFDRGVAQEWLNDLLERTKYL